MSMKVNVSTLVKFPKDGPVATAGVFLPNENILVTGHSNGLVFSWNVTDGSNKRLYSCSDKITTISCSSNKELVVGSHSGDLVVVGLDGKFSVVKHVKGTVQDRVWRCKWINADAFVMTSTYGEVAFFSRDRHGNWTKENVYGYSNSVFGLDLASDGLLASGDYRGNIRILNTNKSDYKIVGKLQASGPIEGIAWHKNDFFAAINQSGRIYLFDHNHDWRLVSEVENATSFGSSICITENGESVFAGTSTEVIQFDTDSLQSDSINISGTVQIFSCKGEVYVLTSYGFLKFERKPVDIKVDLIKFKYTKIGVIGSTGVGKSTLCSVITSDSPGEGISTLGKKVWTWELPKEDNLDKRIILYDYGGQETALSTFLPFLLDSDIILILFQQNDRHTVNVALQIYDSLIKEIPHGTKVFFVQTHIDQPVPPEIDFRRINKLLNDGKIVGNLKISPAKKRGIAEFKDAILKEISWSNSKIMIQNVYSDAVLKTILSLQIKNTSSVSLYEFLHHLDEVSNHLPVSKSHVIFLLENYSNQGVIEYNHKVLDLIIINDPAYNYLKSAVPVAVMQCDGIVPISQLQQKFKDNKYFPAIDAMYLRYKIAIDNHGQRIFPELLKEEPIEVPGHFMTYLKEVPTESKLLPNQRISIEGLIGALSELKMNCIDASKKDGLFSWEENAIIYYRFENTGSAFDGFYLKVSYRIGGKNPPICERLQKMFLTIIERLYGPFQNVENVDLKKKVDDHRDVVYDAAISYAREQLEYAENIEKELSKKGVFVFFDKDQDLEAQMWGKDMSEYLADIYYNKSRYCIMLISKAYVSKAWPTFERQNAIARQIKQMGNYILPIRFDDSVVPGLVPTIQYIRANEKKPEEVANLFVKKLESS